jgi:hypothetical protein
MALSKRRKPAKSGIPRAPDREWRKHRRFVVSHECIVTLKRTGECSAGKPQFAHVRSAANAGKSVKSFDWYGVPLCNDHHKEQHDHGAETFMTKYGIDLWARAAEFTAKSTDHEMRQAMREWQVAHRIEHAGRLPIPPRRRLGGADA